MRKWWSLPIILCLVIFGSFGVAFGVAFDPAYPGGGILAGALPALLILYRAACRSFEKREWGGKARGIIWA